MLSSSAAGEQKGPRSWPLPLPVEAAGTVLEDGDRRSSHGFELPLRPFSDLVGNPLAQLRGDSRHRRPHRGQSRAALGGALPPAPFRLKDHFHFWHLVDARLSSTPHGPPVAHNICGIGFKTADSIAMRLGIERTAMIRARAGVPTPEPGP
jgi:hypothetical protein